MKIRFFNNLVFSFAMIIIQLSFISLIGIAINIYSLIAFTMGTIGFVTNFIVIFWYMKKHFYKIEIDNEGIKWIFKKNNIVFLKWEDIKKLYCSIEWGRGSIRVESEKTELKNLYFNVNYFRLKRVIAICPLEELRVQLKKTRIFYT